MKKIFCDKRTLKSCKIYNMLRAHAKKKHVSFHTPGHKAGDWDITELSYSDNLSCPKGVIAEAERDISALLHSSASFILTDGSTSGIFSMLKASKITSLALPRSAHKCLKRLFNSKYKTCIFRDTLFGRNPVTAMQGRD